MNAATAVPGVPAEVASGTIASNARLLSVSQVIRRALRMGILLLAARLLGVADFGSYILLLTVVEMVAILSGSGYSDFLTREIARHPERAWLLGKKITELRLLCILPSLALAFLILVALHFSSSVVMGAAFFGTTLLPRSLTESAQGILKGRRRFAPMTWIEFIQGTTVLGSAAILLLKGLGIRGMIFAELLGCVAGAIYSVAMLTRFLAFDSPRSSPRLGALLRSAFAFNLYPFLSNIYDRVDVVLLAKLAGNFATGIYALPYRVFATMQILPYGVMGALLPEFSSSQPRRDPVETCARAMKFLLLASLILVLATLTFAGPVVHSLFGQSYSASVRTIQILIWAAVPSFLNFALNTLLVASGKERIFLRTTLVCTVFNVLANCIFIPRYSFLAAAVITLLTESLLLIQNWVYLFRATSFKVLPANAVNIVAVFALALGGQWAVSHVLPSVMPGVLAIAVFAVFGFWECGLKFNVAISAAWERHS